MSEAFDSIMKGLTEAKAYREGQLTLKTTTVEIAPLAHWDAKMVKKLRAELGLSQSIFANAIGVSKKTVEAWESGRNEPSGAACRLLEVIGRDKSLLKRERIVIYASPRTSTRKTKTPKAHTSKKVLAR